MGNHAGSAYPLRGGKGNMWEGGPRVSTVMQWPERIPAGEECNQLASTIDILPTIAEITGAKLPEKKIDGLSILPLLTGETEKEIRDVFLYYYYGDLIAVRKNKWKLVFPHNYRSYNKVEPGKDGFPGPYSKGVVNETELYDLKNDISETNNLAKQYPEIVKELEIIGDSARKMLGDRMRNIKGNENRKPGRVQQKLTKVEHKGIGKNINIKSEYSWQYSGVGDSTLINGTLGSLDYSDEEWLGFHAIDFEATIDLGKETDINKIDCGFLINQGSWIFSPELVQFSVSNNGEDFKVIGAFDADAESKNEKQEVKRFSWEVDGQKVRYVKVNARSIGTCPNWHPGAGEKAWLFVDEVVIY